MTTRRGFLKLGFWGGLLLFAGGGTLALRRTRLRASPARLRFFSPAEHSVFSAVCDRIIVVEDGAPTASQVGVASKADGVLAAAAAETQRDFRRLLALFDNALVGLLVRGSLAPFTALRPEEQDATLEAWDRHRLPVLRTGFQAMKRLACACYYASPESYAAVGYPGPPEIAR